MKSNRELHQRLTELVQDERRVTVEIIRHLREAEKRMLYSELGYPSLFSYCTKGLGYSEAAACRRIEAMRAIKDEPAIEAKIASGSLSLSAVSLARTSIRAFERETGEKLKAQDRSAVMRSIEGLSRREAEKVVVSTLVANTSVQLKPETSAALNAAIQKMPAERGLTSGLTRVTFDLSQEELKVIEDLRAISGEWQTAKDLFVALAKKELARKQRERGDAPRLRRGVGSKASPTRKPINKRFISAAVKRQVWQKAQEQCEFVSEATGHRCCAREGLQIDHKITVALGGESVLDNLRLLCRNHNVHAAIGTFGHNKMAEHVPSLRN